MSDKHTYKIGMGVAWLRENGYDSILVEAKVPKLLAKGYYAIDLVGIKNGTKIALECGGSVTRKLNALLEIFTEVWVFPYNESEPYRWSDDMIICQNCGHLRGDDTQ